MNKVSLIDVEYDINMSIIKMEQVASHIVGLLRHQKISRSELAKDLGWSKSRVTKVLSGDENLTIKTMTMITQKLGYDFDIIFHNKNYEKPKQPWQIDRERNAPNLVLSHWNNDTKNVIFQIETGKQVVEAVLAGKEKDLYVSVAQAEKFLHQTSIPVVPLTQLETPAINVTYFKQDMKVPHHE